MEKKLFYLETADKLSDAELADRLYSGDYRVVGNLSIWQRENQQRYSAVRSLAQQQGRVGESPEQRAERHQREAVYHAQPAPMSTEVLVARETFSESKCRELLATGDGARLKLVSPELYAQFKTAAVSFGLIGPNVTASVSDSAKRHETPAPPEMPLEEKCGLVKDQHGVWTGDKASWSKLFMERSKVA